VTASSCLGNSPGQCRQGASQLAQAALEEGQRQRPPHCPMAPVARPNTSRSRCGAGERWPDSTLPHGLAEGLPALSTLRLSQQVISSAITPGLKCCQLIAGRAQNVLLLTGAPTRLLEWLRCKWAVTADSTRLEEVVALHDRKKPYPAATRAPAVLIKRGRRHIVPFAPSSVDGMYKCYSLARGRGCPSPSTKHHTV
jgi:hypothetical protein